MSELVNLIVKRTGVPAATAQAIVKIVVDFLKKKLPAPIAGQIDGLLSSEAKTKSAEKVIGSLTSKLGKKK
jgi:hypothetical protein